MYRQCSEKPDQLIIVLTECGAGRKCAGILFALLPVRILTAVVGRILRGIVRKREYQLTATASFLRLPAIGELSSY